MVNENEQRYGPVIYGRSDWLRFASRSQPLSAICFSKLIAFASVSLIERQAALSLALLRL